MTQDENIVVVIPYIWEEKEVTKLKKLLSKRAGMSCDIHLIEDKERSGWVSVQNDMAGKLDYDWYVYTSQDYFPGRNWLSIAIDTAKHTGKRLIGFNDGKWFGKYATAGLVYKNLIPELYSTGTLLNPNYFMHGSDPDITERAKKLNEYAYASEALLVEIDYYKDIRGGTKFCEQDRKYQDRRKREGYTFDLSLKHV